MEAQTQAVFIFDPESHRYTVNGAEIPSVTQVLKEAGLTKEYSSMEAAERGTVVHLACECADLGINVTDLIVDPYVTAWRRFRSETGFTHSDIENASWHPVYRYAGRIDRVGGANGKKIVLDIKSGAPEPWHALQLAAYAGLMAKPLAWERWAVYLADDGSYSVREYPKAMHLQDFSTFLNALAITNWKRRLL